MTALGLIILVTVCLGREAGWAGPEEAAGAGRKISIADGTSLNSAALYVALQNGYFRQEGLEVDCRLYSGRPPSKR